MQYHSFMNIQQIKQRFEIIGNSPKLNYALETAIRVAPTDLAVYVLGESGVGKESFSKIIHHLSTRKHGPFIAINCGAIPEGTINSELFGHEKGAFTGAIDTRKGYFETVNGGTLFLDEIGELPLETQSRLLRILENGEFIRVGSSKVQKTDVRIITATNKDLLNLVEKGKFREDLYYRLATLPIKVPALRERGLDVILLFKKFLSDVAEKYRTPEKQLTTDAEDLLLNYNWPGNIRQAKNIAEQIGILEDSDLITTESLSKFINNISSQNLPALTNEGRSTDNNFSERDIFYKILLDLKNDVSDLKRVVLGMISSNKIDDEFIEDNKSILTKVLGEGINVVDNKSVNYRKSETESKEDDVKESEYIIEPIEAVNIDENLSLEAKEEELIRKALLKNNHKRKKAALELGISERTLYRKLKQYGIEN